MGYLAKAATSLQVDAITVSVYRTGREAAALQAPRSITMDRDLLLELWNDMWKEGNWVPSWPDTLNTVTAEQAAWKPVEDPQCRSIWEETSHVTYWRRVTLNRLTGGDPPTEAEIDLLDVCCACRSKRRGVAIRS